MTLDLSIIIVTYRVREAVAACLRSIEQHRGDLAVEILVTDNASGDGTTDLISRQFPHVGLIANADNRGFAAACNQCFRLAQGRNVLLLNPDTIVQPGALQRMVAFLDGQPDAGIVGCRIYDQYGKQRLSCFPLPSVSSVLWQHWNLYRFFPPLLYTRYLRQAFLPAGAPMHVGWVTGACFMTRRAVYEALDGLDERYFLFVEEVDFCRRAAQRGWHTYFAPGASVVHLESHSTSQVVPVKLRNHYLSKLHYFAKFEPPHSLLLLRMVFLMELALKALIRAAGAPLSRPPDARQRLRAYFAIARACLTYRANAATTLVRR